MIVEVTRVAYDDMFTLHLPDGSSEELDPDDTKQWFVDRGANIPGVEKALDHCWNFYTVVICIEVPLEPARSNDPNAPQL